MEVVLLIFKGKLLKNKREEWGSKNEKMTQKMLSELLHIEVQAISQWERGVYKPKDPVHLYALGIIFDCNPFDFLEFEEKDKKLIKRIEGVA